MRTASFSCRLLRLDRPEAFLPMESKVFLDRYRLSLGRNGLPVELHRTAQGVTYRAHEIESGREVAVELIPLPSGSAATRARLQESAAAAKQVNHANIPVLLDYAIEDDQLVAVTESFDGHTAEAWVAARGPLPLGAVLRVAMQVAAAFGAATFHRLQHPAINPGNIIFVPGQTAEGDWPAIKILHWLGPNEVAAAGSDARADAAARYASPEQLQGADPDFASSIFSLGCTMWFLLTGTPPAVPGASGVRASVATLRGVPKIVRHLLGRMLRVDPAERPQDPVVLQAYLQTCLARVERREKVSRRFGVPVVATPAKAVAPRPAFKLNGRPLALAALLLLLGTLAVVAVPRLLRSRRIAARTEVVAPAPAPTQFAVAENDLPNDSSTEAAPPAEAPTETSAPSPAAREVASVEPAAAAEQAQRPVAAAEGEDAQPSVAAPETERAQPRVAAASAPVAQAPKEVEAATPVPERAEIAAVSTPPPAEEENIPTEAASPAEFTEEVQPLVTEATPAPKPEVPHTLRESKSKVAAAKPPQKGRKTAAVAAKSRSTTHPTQKKTRLAHSEVRRGRKLPGLRVGSNRAELVGTTSDGRWILSVSSSGERIVVPPPPGLIVRRSLLPRAVPAGFRPRFRMTAAARRDRGFARWR